MTPAASGLRRRLGVALTALAASAVAIAALTFLASEALIERAALDRLLDFELDYLVSSGARPQTADPTSATLLYFRPAVGGHLPAKLAALPPGRHQVTLDRQPFDVRVREIAPDDRAYLAYHTGAFALRERWLLLSLGGAGLAICALAWWLSGWLARRTLRPLNELVGSIRALDPGRRNARLAPHRDADLQVIAEALNAFMTQLDALVERETAFAAAASHELRTPLAVIRGAAELLDDGRVPSPVVQRILRATDDAAQSVEALLLLSRSRQVDLDARKLALDRWLPDLVEPYRAQAAAEGTTLQWQVHGPVERLLVPGAFAIVFTNLLRNALRAARGGTVIVTIAPDRVEVRDDGPGLPPGLDVTRRDAMPTGLTSSGMGLYISRALAERLGWRLELRNAERGGAVATLHFASATESLPGTAL